MAFASFDAKHASAPMSDINMVPLIDVMLVLLVIFIVTAPLLTHAVKLELPRASAQVNQAKADKVEFAIDAGGALYWNGESVSRDEAAARFAGAALQQPQPEIHRRPPRPAPSGSGARPRADPPRPRLPKGGSDTDPESP